MQVCTVDFTDLEIKKCIQFAFSNLKPDNFLNVFFLYNLQKIF